MEMLMRMSFNKETLPNDTISSSMCTYAVRILLTLYILYSKYLSHWWRNSKRGEILLW